MSVQNGERLATKQDLADMYSGILPYLGGMPEVLANKFSKGDLYDTSEKMIGKWVNGKPLYQKVIPLSSDISSGKQATAIDSTASLNIDTLVIGTGIGYIYDEQSYPMGQMTINGYFEASSYYSFSSALKMDSTGTKVILSTNVTRAGYKLKNVKVILQYTKKTDSANSFNIGEATDYSTDEKIIGTWLNGEPLYQKTLDITGVQLANNVTIAHNISNIGSYKSFVRGEIVADNVSYMLPYVDSTYQVNMIVNSIDATNVKLGGKTTWSSSEYSHLYITIQYTKSNS